MSRNIFLHVCSWTRRMSSGCHCEIMTALEAATYMAQLGNYRIDGSTEHSIIGPYTKKEADTIIAENEYEHRRFCE